MKVRCFLFFALLMLANGSHRLLATAAEPGSVLLYGHGAGEADAAYLSALVLTPPDAAYDIAFRIEAATPDPTQFGEAAVVVVGSLDEKSPRPWSGEEVALAQDWVSRGGTIVFLGNSPVVLAASSQRLGAMAALLGASRMQSSTGQQKPASDSKITAGVENAGWMETGGWAAADLDGAQPLLTDGKTSMGTLNQIGEGQVFFFGKDVTRLNAQTGLHSYSRMLGQAILSGRVVKSPTKREPWVLKALGEAVEAVETPPAVRRSLKSTLVLGAATGQPVQIVKEGEGTSVIIVASNSSPSAKAAAELLSSELSRLTGAQVPVVREEGVTVTPGGGEGAARIQLTNGGEVASAMILGDTEIGKSLGVTSEELPLEGYRIVTKGNLLFLCGKDKRPDGFELNGTMFAASAFLERHCGIRWLWPGELGTVYPATRSLLVGPLDETNAPALRIRKMRDMGGGAKRFETDPETGALRGKGSGRRIATSMALLGRDLETQLKKHDESGGWFERAGLGQSYLASATHAFSGWWDLHGAEHPRWFSLQATGLRTQTPPREQFCQSDPQLVKAIAEATVAKFAEDPRRDVVSISPNDVGRNSYCFCEECRRKDPMNAKPAPIRYLIGGLPISAFYPALSDRMVGFFGDVADAVAALKPGAKVGVMAYNAYRSAPLRSRLRDNVLLVFVGTNYFDRFVLETDRRNWNSWSSHAGEMILRPNTLHQGHGMPAVFVKGLSEDLKHCYETGMIGADYDAVVHHWATQGLNYYVLAKLLWDPSLDPEAIVRDYCEKGFGSAASEIREYFSALESHTEEVSKKMGELTSASFLSSDEEEPEAPIGAEFFIRRIPDFYSSEKISEWRAILTRAREKAGDDAVILARIRFLEEGLVYAGWQRDFFQALNTEPEQSQTLKDLAAKRRSEFQRIFDENYFSVQFALALWREEYFWKLAGVSVSPKPRSE